MGRRLKKAIEAGKTQMEKLLRRRPRQTSSVCEHSEVASQPSQTPVSGRGFDGVMGSDASRSVVPRGSGTSVETISMTQDERTSPSSKCRFEVKSFDTLESCPTLPGQMNESFVSSNGRDISWQSAYIVEDISSMLGEAMSGGFMGGCAFDPEADDDICRESSRAAFLSDGHQEPSLAMSSRSSHGSADAEHATFLGPCSGVGKSEVGIPPHILETVPESSAASALGGPALAMSSRSSHGSADAEYATFLGPCSGVGKSEAGSPPHFLETVPESSTTSAPGGPALMHGQGLACPSLRDSVSTSWQQHPANTSEHLLADSVRDVCDGSGSSGSSRKSSSVIWDSGVVVEQMDGTLAHAEGNDGRYTHVGNGESDGSSFWSLSDSFPSEDDEDRSLEVSLGPGSASSEEAHALALGPNEGVEADQADVVNENAEAPGGNQEASTQTSPVARRPPLLPRLGAHRSSGSQEQRDAGDAEQQLATHAFDGHWLAVGHPGGTSAWLSRLTIQGITVVDGRGSTCALEHRRGAWTLFGGRVHIDGDRLFRIGRSGTVHAFARAGSV